MVFWTGIALFLMVLLGSFVPKNFNESLLEFIQVLNILLGYGFLAIGWVFYIQKMRAFRTFWFATAFVHLMNYGGIFSWLGLFFFRFWSHFFALPNTLFGKAFLIERGESIFFTIYDVRLIIENWRLWIESSVPCRTKLDLSPRICRLKVYVYKSVMLWTKV